MNDRSGGPAIPSYQERRRRAVELRQRQSHAHELLDLYVELLALQEPLYREALQSGWLPLVRADDAEPPSLRLQSLPFVKSVESFRKFAERVAGVTTDTLRHGGARLLAQEDAELSELLRRGASRSSVDDLAAIAGVEAVLLEFYARVYLEPVTQALASIDEGGQPLAAMTRVCPRCTWPPQATVMRDEVDARGRRLLVCAMCGTWWPFARVTCVNCGEDDPKKLGVHEGGPLEHVRLETCETCQAYVKSVDLRRDGTAVPVVDELASVELDLWADEQGLWKVQRNVLAL